MWRWREWVGRGRVGHHVSSFPHPNYPPPSGLASASFNHRFLSAYERGDPERYKPLSQDKRPVILAIATCVAVRERKKEKMSEKHFPLSDLKSNVPLTQSMWRVEEGLSNTKSLHTYKNLWCYIPG